MSWILGAIGNIDSTIHLVDREAPGARLIEFKTANSYFLAGGIPETCFFGHLDSPDKDTGFWVVCGLGIGATHGRKHILKQEDWQAAILSGLFHIQHEIEGQYCGVIVKGDEARWFSDSIGSRDLFWTSIGDAHFISTRIDWLSRIRGGAVLNPSAFSTRWLCFNQLSYESVLQEIKRLGPSGIAVLERGAVTLSNRPWEASATGSKGIVDSLEDLLYAPSASGISVSLGLSGGIDSRVLFSLLLQKKTTDWSVYTFGDKSHPDSLVAREIAQAYNVHQIHCDEELPSPLESIEQMKEYAAHAMILRQASEFIQLQNFSTMYAKDRILTDGSFGELGRRQMLKRIALKGKRAVERGAFEELFTHLFRKRADIFNDSLTNDLHRHAKEQITQAGERLPDVKQVGIENWLDLFVIRYNVPNVNTAEQARIDHYVPSYMPFLQPSLLSEIFHSPLHERRNGKLFRRIIREKEPRLIQYPLVGVDAVYPFILPPLPAYLYRKVKTKLGLGIKPARQIAFLHYIREFVEDTLLSSDTLSFGYYDPVKIRRIVNGYYAGNESLVRELDWLLAFDIWRRRVLLTS